MSDKKIKHYLDLFSTNTEAMQRYFAQAMKKGGDFCDLYFQNTFSNVVVLEDKQVNRAFTNIDLGVGIRVLKGNQTGYSFSEDISEKAILNAAAVAGSIADSNVSYKPIGLNAHATKNFYPIKTTWESIESQAIIDILLRLDQIVQKLDNRVIKTNIWFTRESSQILVANTNGTLAFDDRPLGQINLVIVAEQGGERQQNSYSISVRNDIDYFTEEILQRIASEAIAKTMILFDAITPKGGEMTVVLAAGSSGILLHEAIGHGMEADFNRKKTSIYTEMMNQQIAPEFVTIVDNGTIPHCRGSINIDDEGTSSQDTVLVEKGILKSYLHDLMSAKHYDVSPTGNGRRESFRHIPLPRMRNTYMLDGPHTHDEIVSSIQNGIYCQTFTNGQVNIGGGDFTFFVKNGYLIENGKLTQPIKDINIIGNGPEVLQNIQMAANDFEMSEGGWTCGKDGQGVPVSQGLPTIKVDCINVGGN
ncbi:metallopeptidase TldD-related protein [Bacteroidales bacterium]|nr:metallopeptidase TldD-related protein [Bacteroidales bacterium]